MNSELVLVQSGEFDKRLLTQITFIIYLNRVPRFESDFLDRNVSVVVLFDVILYIILPSLLKVAR